MIYHFEVVFWWIIFVGLDAKAHQINLYTKTMYNSKVTNFSIHIANCINIHSEVIGKVQSGYNNRDYDCTQFYEQENCTGKSIQLSTMSPFQENLTQWNFHKKTKSIGPCKKACIPEKGAHAFSNESVHVTLYSEPFFLGEASQMQVNGCTYLNSSQDFKSIDIPRDACVLGFLTDSAIEPGFINEDCVVRQYQNVVEFRDGMPHLYNLPSWPHFSRRRKIIALSPCQCQTFTSSAALNLLKFTKEEHIIILFSEQKFGGTFVKIPLNFTESDNVSNCNSSISNDDHLHLSMYIADGACIELFKESDCIGSSHVRLTGPFYAAYLSDFNFRSFRVFKTDGEESSVSSHLMYFLLTVVCVTSIVAVVAVVVLLRITSTKHETERLSEKDIVEFMEGLGLGFENDNGNDMNVNFTCGNDDAIIGAADSTPKLSSDLIAQNQPYNCQLEIPLNRLKFDSRNPIGTGEFGNVFKGILTKPSLSIPVAIKTTKPYSNAQYLRALLKEVKTMMYVGQHPKIVTLIGCCTMNIREGELFIVMEYCEKGSLESFLKSNQTKFVNIVQKGKLNPGPSSSFNFILQPTDSKRYTKLVSTCDSSTSNYCHNRTRKFDIIQLISWSIEIAEGMEYLASKRIIHGDLSARNVLLNAALEAKISDFGLSRKMYCYSYKSKNEEPLPWRWLALESLKNLEFSTKSDVWSFGILLWEIFTLGEQPYPGVPSLTNSFIVNLEQGLRLTIPTFTTSECYNIMSSCWNEDSKCRPSFSCMISSLREIRNVCKNQISSGTMSSPTGVGENGKELLTKFFGKSNTVT